MRLLRFVDADEPDLSLVSWEVSHFRDSIRATWAGAGVFRLPRANVNLMLVNLQTPYFFQDQSGKLRRACGRTYSQTNRCVQRSLGRMRVWQDLALSCLETEFPSYEACQSFSVLCLGDVRRHDVASSLRVKSDQVCRLARLACVDPAALLEQHDAHHPVAAMYYNSSGLTTLEAWRRSLLRHDRGQCADLLAAVVKYAACGISTHRIESLFSILRLRMKCRAASQAPRSEIDTVQLLVHIVGMPRTYSK